MPKQPTTPVGLTLDRAFHERGWLFYAGDANEETIAGIVERDFASTIPSSQAHGGESNGELDPPSGAVSLFAWLLNRAHLITPYASLKFAIEEALSTKIFSRYSDRFTSFQSALKYCPGWFSDDMQPTAMYTIILKRSNDDRERDDAWNTLHSIGHTLRIHSALRGMPRNELTDHVTSYRKWLKRSCGYPRLAGLSPQQVELDADIFAALAMKRLGRPIIERYFDDVSVPERLFRRMRIANVWGKRSQLNQLAEVASTLSEIRRGDSSSWIDQSLRSPSLNKPADFSSDDHELGEKDSRDLDLLFSKEEAERWLDPLKASVDRQAYAPFRALIEFSTRLVTHSQTFFNLSIHCKPHRNWDVEPLRLRSRRFKQAAKELGIDGVPIDCDYTHYIVEVPIPKDVPLSEWTPDVQIEVVRSLASIYVALVTGKLNKTSLQSSPRIDFGENPEFNAAVDLVSSIACAVWRTPSDLIPTRPWEWSRAIISLSPFAESLRQKLNWSLTPEIPTEYSNSRRELIAQKRVVTR